jgi:aminoglycoside phosphotransferase family enzyme/predicted kinase
MTLPTEKIIEELSRPGAYPYPVDKVYIMQTHISIVFLAGDKVYKVKKPVDFGFLDFTTLEKRKWFCEEELRLNRRLSPGTYLKVVAVTQGPDGLRFGEIDVADGAGPGHTTQESPALEYAVVMERLDENMMLSELLDRGEADRSLMETIALRIAQFHQESETSPYITKIGGTRAVKFNTEEDFQQIEPYIGKTLDRSTYNRIGEFTRTFIEVNAQLFASREKNGWIRDGHGDLHSQHICLSDSTQNGGIQIFDCIEFNERFRFGDVLVDAAFLAMDLERLGFTELADHYTKAYLKSMDQEEQTALFNFYACYRAVVRGKVEGFRSSDPNVSEEEAASARESARTFHQLAEKYARTIHPPTLVVGCGLMGSGKSTVSSGLSEFVDFELLSSDKIRKELAGVAPADTHHVPYGEDIYSEPYTQNTYSTMHARALELLEKGQSVFLDASYMDPEMRADAAETARKAGARFLLVYMAGNEDTLRSRLRDRAKRTGEISDGREEILAEQMAAFVPPEEFHPEVLLTVDPSKAAKETIRELYCRLLSSS